MYAPLGGSTCLFCFDVGQKVYMHYKLLGFSQNGPIRRFVFQRIVVGAVPVPLSVTADISLARRLNLALQELPGLCSRLLESVDHEQGSLNLALSELHMAEARDLVIAQKAAAPSRGGYKAPITPRA